MSFFFCPIWWAGKCSHGGFLDQTAKMEPMGGINKDKPTSNHGFLHTDAANLALAASSQLLEDIRAAIGDKPFLQYETHSACVTLLSVCVCVQ